MARETLKTPAQTAWQRSDPLEAPVATPRLIHNVSVVAGASSSLIHRTPLWNGLGKRSGGALHPLPRTSASLVPQENGPLSTDVERSVDNLVKPQVSGSHEVPGL